MKQIIIALLFIVGSSAAYAQDYAKDIVSNQRGDASTSVCDRHPLNTKLTIALGNSTMTNHYLNLQEYTGSIFGLTGKFGRFYRESERLSWELSMSHMRNVHDDAMPSDGDLTNPAETSYMSYRGFDVDYAVYYNWLLFDRLQVKAGGYFNVYGDMMQGDKNAINNIISINAQALINAAVGVRYGWDFDNFGLDIYGNLSTPLFGLMAADHSSESAIETMVPSQFNIKEYNHFRFTSFNNLQGINGEIGADIALEHFTISLSYESRNRWWHAFGLQNYRKLSYIKVGASFNLLSHQNKKSINRHF